MARNSKQQVRMIFKLAAFGSFIMLGYLGLRSYKQSVEKLKINGCIEEVIELTMNVRERFPNNDYANLDYNTANRLNLFPKRMNKEGYREKVNSFFGGVDLFYSSLGEGLETKAFEVSFQGVSSWACKELIRLNWDGGMQTNVIAVAGYARATASGVLDTIYPETKQESIQRQNVYKGNVARFVSEDKLDYACSCGDDTCTVVWKFR